LGNVRVEEQLRHAADVDAPDLEDEIVAKQLQRQQQGCAFRRRHTADRQVVRLPQVTPKAALLKKFIFYALTTGQKFGIPLRYVPIPKQVLVASEKTLNKVHS
jgi:hypothetical protein